MSKTVFISWSKSVSKDFADKLYTKLEELPLGVDCWCSIRAKDLPQGPNDHARIIDAAKNSDFCVSIVTPDNIRSPWLHFETGLFYGQGKKVFGLLTCGVSYQQLKASNFPLEGYYCELDNLESFTTFVHSVNSEGNNIEKHRYHNSIERLHNELAILEQNHKSTYQDPILEDVADLKLNPF